jgi:zinc/manganese transport system substrate-binding protein
MTVRISLLAASLLLGFTAATQAAPAIVAAENMYGDVAAQIAGPDATVSSILSNPDQDPHLFEASPSVARALSTAALVIYNGADYDPWMEKLLAAAPVAGRPVIMAATLMHKKPGDNPHLWYDTATMRAVAGAVSSALSAQDPAHAAAYARRTQTFDAALDQLDAKVATLRTRYAKTPVTATEPVFGLMATAIGLTMRNERFQLAVMNDTEPRVSDTAAFEDDLVHHRVRVLFYNSQASGPAAQRLLGIARKSNIPVVPVTETEPANTSYQTWMTHQLDALDAALAAKP